MSLIRSLRNPLLCLLPAIVCFSGCGQKASEQLELVERFDGNNFNRNLWHIAQPGKDIATVTVENESLLFKVPPADQPRPQVTSSAKVELKKNFSVQFDYRLLSSIPDPDAEYTNIELIVHGKDASAHFSRTNHKGAGNGYVSYLAPRSDGMEGHWNHTATSAMSGTLKLQRAGEKLQYLVKEKEAGDFSEVASVVFGTEPVHEVSVALTMAAPLSQQFEFTVDNLEIRTLPDED